jgi:hypothetical protein
VRQRWAGEAAVEAEIDEIIEAVAFAPPKNALGVIDDAGAIAEFDEAELIVDVSAREKNGVGEIDDQRGGGVIADDHVAAEERASRAGVEKAGAACSCEAEDARDDVAGASGDVGDHGAQAAAGRPAGGRSRLGEVTLARLEHYADLMHAGIDAACGCGGASSAGGESTCGRGESELCGAGNRGNWERTVVAGDSDADGRDQLADDESVRAGGRDRGGGARSGAAAAGS